MYQGERTSIRFMTRLEETIMVDVASVACCRCRHRRWRVLRTRLPPSGKPTAENSVACIRSNCDSCVAVVTPPSPPVPPISKNHPKMQTEPSSIANRHANREREIASSPQKPNARQLTPDVQRSLFRETLFPKPYRKPLPKPFDLLTF